MRPIKNCGVGEIWKIDKKGVCTATHPDYPNYSGTSRGRKIHLAKDTKKTICNMLIDEYIPDLDRHWAMVSNGRCKICFKNIKETP